LLGKRYIPNLNFLRHLALDVQLQMSDNDSSNKLSLCFRVLSAYDLLCVASLVKFEIGEHFYLDVMAHFLSDHHMTLWP